ncbi:MAG: DUF4367 domain-containing protein [Oscillospiraceae bacterium]|nr:DUF4367 domain-containing protein [Oscillospiraceae bacterium]
MNKKLFSKAAAEAEKLDALDLPHFNGYPYEVSPDFKEKILFLAAPKKRDKRTARRIICISAALLALAAGAMGAEAFHNPVKDFVIQFFEKFSYADFDAKKTFSPQDIKEFSPTWLPDGYTLDSSEKNNDFFRLAYKNPAGEKLVFKQTLATGSIMFDTESGSKKVEKLKIGNCEAFFYSSDKSSTLYWSDGICLFSLSGDISRDEMIKVAENIK